MTSESKDAKKLIVRDLDEDLLKKVDAQKKKYGLKSRSEYIRLLINLDVLTNIISLINKDNKK